MDFAIAGGRTFAPKERKSKGFELASKLFLAGVVIYLLYASYNFLTSDPRFQITDVTFSGNHALLENQLLEWLGQVHGGNLFAYDLSRASERLAEHPWVLSASVQRKFPQKIQIELTERVPYARIKFEKVFLMDNFGVILSEEKPEYRNLPLIVQPGVKPENFSGERVIQSLKTMHYFNKLSFFEKNPLDIAELKGHSRIIFSTRNRDLQIQMSMETLTEGFKKFRIVLDTLEDDAVKIQMIDLSFKDQVVVRDRIPSHSTSMKTPTN
jgi:cell division septal protein FtsQ